MPRKTELWIKQFLYRNSECSDLKTCPSGATPSTGSRAKARVVDRAAARAMEGAVVTAAKAAFDDRLSPNLIGKEVPSCDVFSYRSC
jgi:hypothetical protein